jgi:hypothetical protein
MQNVITFTPVTLQDVSTTCNTVQSNYKSSQILTLSNFKSVSSPRPAYSHNYVQTSNIPFIHNMAFILLNMPTLHNIFRVCKSVHHHTFNGINQQDTATSQVYYLSFKYSSTCFGHPHVHH